MDQVGREPSGTELLEPLVSVGINRHQPASSERKPIREFAEAIRETSVTTMLWLELATH